MNKIKEIPEKPKSLKFWEIICLLFIVTIIGTFITLIILIANFILNSHMQSI